MTDAQEGWKKSTPEQVQRGETQMGIACIQGKVVLKFPQPMEHVALGAENARFIAEAIGRAAYEAHYGKAPPDDMRSALAQQIRDNITDELRDRMIARFTLVVPSMVNQSKTPGRIAMEMVDILLREVTL